MTKPFALITLLCIFCEALPAQAGNLCTAQSGRATAAVVELYSSEGCSSCPPADRQLSKLKNELGANALVVPLALHVTYWDSLGWKDSLGQAIFDARQKELTMGSQSRFAYTPEFFVNGTELQAWSNALPDTIKRINQQPAPVTITLSSTPVSNDMVSLKASVAARDPQPNSALYLAITESGLTSHVSRGENSGTTLTHDDAVRIWLGPIPLNHGNAQVRQEVKLSPAWNRKQLQAVAFVQDTRNGAVLQAVETGACGVGSDQ
jgi:hypothetical protein